MKNAGLELEYYYLNHNKMTSFAMACFYLLVDKTQVWLLGCDPAHPFTLPSITNAHDREF